MVLITRDTFESEIRSIVDQLLKGYRPQKIILFGSLVWGSLNQSTDIDLMLVKRDVPRYGADRIRDVQRLVKHRLATDFLIYTPEEIQKRLALGDPFVAQILNEGRVLFDAA
jgi:predicted nucleotidyltransferase